MIRNLLIILFVCFFVTGCYKNDICLPTYIPTKCEIELPKRPIKNGNEIIDTKNMLIYTELLEFNLRFCTGQN